MCMYTPNAAATTSYTRAVDSCAPAVQLPATEAADIATGIGGDTGYDPAPSMDDAGFGLAAQLQRSRVSDAGGSGVATATNALRMKLAPFADTIDAQEAHMVATVVSDAEQRGKYHADEVASLLVQVEGSALGLRQEYLDAALQAQDLLRQTRIDMETMTEQMLAGGFPTAQDMAALDEMADNQLAAQTALKQNFELAKRDPAAALTQLQQFAAAPA